MTLDPVAHARVIYSELRQHRELALQVVASNFVAATEPERRTYWLDVRRELARLFGREVAA